MAVPWLECPPVDADDALAQQAGVDVECPLAAARALNHHGYERLRPQLLQLLRRPARQGQGAAAGVQAAAAAAGGGSGVGVCGWGWMPRNPTASQAAAHPRLRPRVPHSGASSASSLEALCIALALSSMSWNVCRCADGAVQRGFGGMGAQNPIKRVLHCTAQRLRP